jgi:hypothetical protein
LRKILKKEKLNLEKSLGELERKEQEDLNLREEFLNQKS